MDRSNEQQVRFVPNCFHHRCKRRLRNQGSNKIDVVFFNIPNTYEMTCRSNCQLVASIVIFRSLFSQNLLYFVCYAPTRTYLFVIKSPHDLESLFVQKIDHTPFVWLFDYRISRINLNVCVSEQRA